MSKSQKRQPSTRRKMVLHSKKQSQEAQEILRGLLKFNRRFGGREDWRPLTIAIKDSNGKVIAGLTGHTDWRWLFVRLLWVSEAYRQTGLGSQLMMKAEQEARRRKCSNIWLDTFEFQAPGFYRKLGYRKFGELNDYPVGYKRFFYTKKL